MRHLVRLLSLYLVKPALRAGRAPRCPPLLGQLVAGRRKRKWPEVIRPFSTFVTGPESVRLRTRPPAAWTLPVRAPLVADSFHRRKTYAARFHSGPRSRFNGRGGCQSYKNPYALDISPNDTQCIGFLHTEQQGALSSDFGD